MPHSHNGNENYLLYFAMYNAYLLPKIFEGKIMCDVHGYDYIAWASSVYDTQKNVCVHLCRGTLYTVEYMEKRVIGKRRASYSHYT